MNKQIGHVGVFDYYILQMSFALEFCRLNKNRQHDPECTGNFNLVLHGLWCQYNTPIIIDHEKYHGPQFCPSNFKIDNINEILDSIPKLDDIAPEYRTLAIHEWNRHGTASGLSPKDYFQKAINLALEIPQHKITSNTSMEEVKQMYPNGEVIFDESKILQAINFKIPK